MEARPKRTRQADGLLLALVVLRTSDSTYHDQFTWRIAGLVGDESEQVGQAHQIAQRPLLQVPMAVGGHQVELAPEETQVEVDEAGATKKLLVAAGVQLATDTELTFPRHCEVGRLQLGPPWARRFRSTSSQYSSWL